jgi:hypothetical protein
MPYSWFGTMVVPAAPTSDAKYSDHCAKYGSNDGSHGCNNGCTVCAFAAALRAWGRLGGRRRGSAWGAVSGRRRINGACIASPQRQQQQHTSCNMAADWPTSVLLPSWQVDSPHKNRTCTMCTMVAIMPKPWARKAAESAHRLSQRQVF